MSKISFLIKSIYLFFIIILPVFLYVLLIRDINPNYRIFLVLLLFVFFIFEFQQLSYIFFKQYFIFPSNYLISGEHLEFELDNAWIINRQRGIMYFSIFAYKTHIAFTNKRMIFAKIKRGKLIFNDEAFSIWYDENKNYINDINLTDVISKSEDCIKISYVTGKSNILLIIYHPLAFKSYSYLKTNLNKI
jgi:hypothetical protein